MNPIINTLNDLEEAVENHNFDYAKVIILEWKAEITKRKEDPIAKVKEVFGGDTKINELNTGFKFNTESLSNEELQELGQLSFGNDISINRSGTGLTVAITNAED